MAGIGIGRFDPVFFSQAFLFFTTNLVGITLAAAITFRLLGYSAAVKSKCGIGVVVLLLILISISLHLSYYQIVETRNFDRDDRKNGFLFITNI